MQPLKIEPTTSSFAVDLDIEKGEFRFSGESRPENAPRFFEPILSWLNAFKEMKAKENNDYNLKVIFNFDYFNSTSRSEEHTSELQSRPHLVCRLLLEKKKNK